jgi:hypothetical protein
VDVDRWGGALVDIKTENTGVTLDDLEQAGAAILNVVDDDVRARIDLSRLEEVANLPQVISIRPAAKFITLGNGGKELGTVPNQPRPAMRPGKSVSRAPDELRRAIVTAGLRNRTQGTLLPAATNSSEGDVAHRAAEARDFYGYDGTGVKVGVLSDGVDSLARLQASGDLPQNVTVLSGQAGEGDEGAAMLEIIHDLAPSAQLFFATGLGGISAFARNIRDLRFVSHCDIIVDDALYLAESAFQDGQTGSARSPNNLALIAQAVNDVTADGALYFSGAGNGGNKDDGTASTWEGDFRAANFTPPLIHDFGGGVVFNTVTANSVVVLQWSDALGLSSNDYDLFIFNSSLTSIVAASINVQNGDDDPVELTTARAGERIVLATFGAPPVRFLSLRTFPGAMSLTTAGSTFGHSAAANCFSVGAVSARSAKGPGGIFNGTEMTELFSSDGPRRLYYGSDGTPLTPGNLTSTGGSARQKPDICAADGVATAVPSLNPFFGTSAAAPHAAAIAALLLSAKRTLTPAQIRTALTGSALDIEAPGIDRDSGSGIVMAFQALQAIGAVPLPKVTAASVSGKKLFVDGRSFSDGAKILLDGEQQKTANDEASPSTRLIGKKAGKRIASGQTVNLQVRNSDGLVSREFRFTKP